ncbi:ras association domain-containing protein 2 isoform X2 [Strongylocentrotus purpuratus]|uniref:Ras association domain-containing protein 6 n=1 Tax=Strongylocentrotus purpuratus TaxID=7668 RepID=A0A7M7NFK6_STRPU|nr:ras association domain-containing protein 2 isoform X2 [Strongylocentrotus purpuratus]XP_030835667.1 ras association domain-containing protein 2 isoform X2 [Strongylocentrotus purpuratus]XP_030835668.1 ras association domain-containing protein 2 isoform X2 [Strongylocentrotus purpuratus]XP_030835669.1 ras association domain-containing protein 2 isoform X2 [Strongylocentrotus purpuratus]
MTDEGGDMLETRYRSHVTRQSFASDLKQYNLYFAGSRPSQQLQIHERKGMPVVYGVLKLYWGTQQVIRLKKEEPTWKRKSIRLAYENGLDEKLMNAMGSGARNRRSLTKLRDSVSEIPEDCEGSDNDHEREEGGRNGVSKKEDNMAVFDRLTMSNSLPRDALNNHDVIAEIEKAANGSPNGEIDQKLLSSTMPKKSNLRRRTMSFSGHLYNSKTRAFRPRYGTVSNIRASSTQSTQEVIKLLLTKFAVENPPEEFSLFSVSNSAGTQELKALDFPLLRRIQLGPDENVAKIFVMERKTTSQVSQEVAQYVNLPITVLGGILKKFKEEENKEIEEIRKKYSIYQATLKKKMEVIMESTSDIEPYNLETFC